jgi:hypothetical protein
MLTLYIVIYYFGPINLCLKDSPLTREISFILTTCSLRRERRSGLAPLREKVRGVGVLYIVLIHNFGRRVKMAKGLTSYMRDRFYPDYVFCGSKVLGGHSGHSDFYMRGRDVDLEIRRWVETGASVSHPYSKKFVMWVEYKKLVAVHAQLAVGDAKIRTFIDVILKDRRGRHIVVEVKTGFHGYHDASSGLMRKEFSFLSNSPRNQHLLQAAFSEQLYRRTCVNAPVSGSLVLRINDGGVHVLYPPAKMKCEVVKILNAA